MDPHRSGAHPQAPPSRIETLAVPLKAGEEAGQEQGHNLPLCQKLVTSPARPDAGGVPAPVRDRIELSAAVQQSDTYLDEGPEDAPPLCGREPPARERVGREEVDESVDNEARARRENGPRGPPPLSEVPGHAPVHPREEVRVHTGHRSAGEKTERWLGGEVITNY